jgi:uncharacterized protein
MDANCKTDTFNFKTFETEQSLVFRLPMAVDKNDSNTWIKYSSSMCSTCIAACCMMPVEVTGADLAAMGYLESLDLDVTQERLSAKRLVRLGIVKHYRENTRLFTLVQQSDGSCIFLEKSTRQCKVYSCRPAVCRQFPISKGNRLGYCPYKEKPPTK